MTDPMPVVCLVRDLLFASRITGAAAGLAVPVRVVRDPAHLAAVDGRLLLVDLNQADAIPAAAAWQARTGRPAVGFVSHVDAETIAEARSAAVTRVLARSGFVRELPTLLKEAADPTGGPPPATLRPPA